MSEAPVPSDTAAGSAGAEAEEQSKSLLQQMEELLAAVSADLSQLDANLQGDTTARGADEA
ncbi:hypothetical protein [Phaeacidiphilus oryzae]|jgi:hypothetical protein|uniref:hypothetical protein n=1 Tax=Phaeacidiphilus oryzae TaxID=348818 RepID=UPI00056B7920|nr:hypothetical protein [Phaeacidiphilus oryzae]